MATELEKLGHSLNNRLWSASLLDKHPGEIQKVHRSYLEAGADCITTATYQASIPGFLESGFSENKGRALLIRAVEIACDARDQFSEHTGNPQELNPLVAASIGPYGAYLADGSEFRGDYSVTDEQLRSFHEPRWEILTTTSADLFAIETIPSFREAAVLHELLESTADIHAWISFSCADGLHINDGTPLAECAELFKSCKQIVGIGVNCTAPRYISSLIREARKGSPNTPVVVYPNSGEVYNGHFKNWTYSSDPVDFGDTAIDWFNHGARLIGGCCRINPHQIGKTKRALLNLK